MFNKTNENAFVQQPRWKCNFGGSLKDEEVIDSSIDDMIVEEIQFNPLLGKVNESSTDSVKEVTLRGYT